MADLFKWAFLWDEHEKKVKKVLAGLIPSENPKTFAGKHQQILDAQAKCKTKKPLRHQKP